MMVVVVVVVVRFGGGHPQSLNGEISRLKWDSVGEKTVVGPGKNGSDRKRGLVRLDLLVQCGVFWSRIFE